MEKIIIEGSLNTPEITIHSNPNYITIKGVCAPENPKKFFSEFIHQVEFLIADVKPLEITIHLDYFNTGSSRSLLDFLLIRANDAFKNITKVHWIVEGGDDDLFEAGKMLEELSGLPFHFKEI